MTGGACWHKKGQPYYQIAKPFKDRALELLEEAYPSPLKAADIRQKIQVEYDAEYHEKTAGMSLYRLSRKGLVRREGHDWYFVPKDQRNKEIPGSGVEPDDPGISNN